MGHAQKPGKPAQVSKRDALAQVGLCIRQAGELVQGRHASWLRNTFLMRPGIFGSALSAANRRARCEFRKSLRYSLQWVLKRPAWRCGMWA